MPRIHCISGLGADQRIFQKLSIPGAELTPVHWAQFDRHDDIPCYAQKMAATIPEEAPVILGVSFGGMIASEIARIRPAAKVIIVSSAKDVTELPPVGGFVRFVIDAKLLPMGLMRMPSKQIFERFGAVTDEEQRLLANILADTDGPFAKWSAKAMINWQSRDHAPGIVHIHGTADRLISPEFIHPTHWVDGGTHFMVYHRAAEISALISQHLA